MPSMKWVWWQMASKVRNTTKSGIPWVKSNPNLLLDCFPKKQSANVSCFHFFIFFHLFSPRFEFASSLFSFFSKNISIHKLCPQSLLKHSVVHFQGIAMEFQHFFSKYFWSKYVCQKMLKHGIPIHKLCPQSLLKHSVVHFQGLAMKF